MRLLSSILISTAVIIFSACGVDAGAINKVIAVVNDEVITQRELEEALAPIYAQYKTAYGGEELDQRLEEARRNLLNQLIEDKLILQEARRQEIPVDEKEIDEVIEKVKLGFSSQEEFEETLRTQGLSVEGLREKYRNQLMMKKLISRQVSAKIVATPAEITEYYQSHIDSFSEPEQVKVRGILIKADDEDSPDQALKKANGLLKLLEEGADFGELAKEYSQDSNAAYGGQMGYIKRGDMLEEIDKVIFVLAVGEVSGIIPTKLGYYIFKVEDRKTGGVKSLSEVQTEIQNIIFHGKAQQRLREWIDRLKENAYISIR